MLKLVFKSSSRFILLKISLCLVSLFAFNLARAKDTISVGSRDFPESVLLAEILSSAIENNTDLAVDRKFHLGGVKVCVTAMQANSLDIYPDYTGSLMHNLLGEKSPTEYLDDYLRTSLEQKYKFSLSDKLGFDNSFVLVVRRDFADKHQLKTLSDLQLLMIKEPSLEASLQVAFKHSFIARPDGYDQLKTIYGFDFKNLRAMEYNIAYDQLKAGRIDLIDAFSTDSRLLDPSLQVLVDDRSALLAYDSVFVLRDELLAKHPELISVLKLLNNSLSNERIIELNKRVAAGETYNKVAQSFLTSLGSGSQKALIEPVSRFQQDSRLLLRALKQHLILSLTALLIAIVLGISLGIYISYNAIAARIILAIGSVTQVIPSLALLALLIPIFGLGFKPALVALSIYALLPIVQNTYTGIISIAPEYMDLARSLALKPWTIISKVQVPMALATIIAGIRTSSVICIGAATLATFVGAGGLGDLIKAGIDLNSNYMIALGAVPAAILALSISYALSLIEKRVLVN